MEPQEGSLHDPGFGRREVAIVALLFVVAAALRVAYVVSVSDHPAVVHPSLDSMAYHDRALHILAGEWLPGRIPYQAPLYPYFLALLYAVLGPGSVGVLVAQALLDAGTVLLVVALARRVFGVPCALIAGGLAALYEPSLYFDALLLKVALAGFLVALSLWLLVRADRTDRLGAWLAGGLVLGLACLTRGNLLLFVPVAGAFAVLGDGRLQPARAAAFAAGVLAVVLPLTLHNAWVGGDFVPTTSQGGQNFFAGNHRGNDSGVYLPPAFVRTNPRYEEQDFAAEARRRTGRSLTPSEVSRFWFREGLAEIRADPAHFARHLWKRLRLFLSHHEVDDNQSYDWFVRQVSWMLRLPFPTWAAVLPLAACGIALGARTRAAWIPLAFLATYAASVVLFFTSARLRMPVVPVLVVFAGLALWRAIGWARSRRIGPLLAMAVSLAVAYPLVYADVIETTDAVANRNLGVRHLQLAEQQRQRQLALEAAGDAAGARAARAEARVAMEQAEQHLRRALALEPHDARLRRPLRRLMVRIAVERDAAGDAAGALQQAAAATSLFPRSADAWFQRGRLEALRGDRQVARDALERALALAPGHAAAARELARLRDDAR